MDSIENAQRACHNLNGTDLLDGISMNVYSSNLPKIVFQDNNPGGVDYTEIKKIMLKKKLNESGSFSNTTTTSTPPNRSDQSHRSDFSNDHGYGNFQGNHHQPGSQINQQKLPPFQMLNEQTNVKINPQIAGQNSGIGSGNQGFQTSNLANFMGQKQFVDDFQQNQFKQQQIPQLNASSQGKNLLPFANGQIDMSNPSKVQQYQLQLQQQMMLLQQQQQSLQTQIDQTIIQPGINQNMYQQNMNPFGFQMAQNLPNPNMPFNMFQQLQPSQIQQSGTMFPNQEIYQQYMLQQQQQQNLFQQHNQFQQFQQMQMQLLQQQQMQQQQQQSHFNNQFGLQNNGQFNQQPFGQQQVFQTFQMGNSFGAVPQSPQQAPMTQQPISGFFGGLQNLSDKQNSDSLKGVQMQGSQDNKFAQDDQDFIEKGLNSLGLNEQGNRKTGGTAQTTEFKDPNDILTLPKKQKKQQQFDSTTKPPLLEDINMVASDYSEENGNGDDQGEKGYQDEKDFLEIFNILDEHNSAEEMAMNQKKSNQSHNSNQYAKNFAQMNSSNNSSDILSVGGAMQNNQSGSISSINSGSQANTFFHSAGFRNNTNEVGLLDGVNMHGDDSSSIASSIGMHIAGGGGGGGCGSQNSSQFGGDSYAFSDEGNPANQSNSMPFFMFNQNSQQRLSSSAGINNSLSQKVASSAVRNKKLNHSMNSMPSSMLQQHQIQQQLQHKGNPVYDDINPAMNIADYVNPQFMKTLRKSKVIYARWFDKNHVTLRMLFNVFSYFGNIEKMMYMKNKSSCLVEYEKLESASLAKENLNELTFMKQELKIFFSNYDQVFIKNFKNDSSSCWSENEDGTEEYYASHASMNRYKSDLSISYQRLVNPISDCVIMTGLKREACNIDILAALLSDVGPILRSKFIIDESLKNMCILKLPSKEKALEAIAHYHGQEICDKKVSIGFSKVRLLDHPSSFNQNQTLSAELADPASQHYNNQDEEN